MNRREMLATTSAATLAALCMPKLTKAEAPASRVAIVPCRDYAQYGQQLSRAFDQIGGIEKLVRGKTVTLKLNLTGNPKNFPLTPELPYRTDPQSVAATVHLFARAGARRVRMIESFFPADQDRTPPFIRGDNSLRLAEEAGIGTRDLKRIEVVGLSIKDAHINFGPGAVGKKMSELK